MLRKDDYAKASRYRDGMSSRVTLLSMMALMSGSVGVL
jgi:hypothetical protein